LFARGAASGDRRCGTSWLSHIRRRRLPFTTVDRVRWAWLSQRWPGWRAARHDVQPAAVLACVVAPLLAVQDSTSHQQSGDDARLPPTTRRSS